MFGFKTQSCVNLNPNTQWECLEEFIWTRILTQTFMQVSRIFNKNSKWYDISCLQLLLKKNWERGNDY